MTTCVSLRYRRKGSSCLGLDFRRQGVSWEDSETKKKKKKVGVNGNAADRYFSVATRKLLRAAPPVPVVPAIPESGDALNSTTFLPLGDAERHNTRHELGNDSRMLTLNKTSLTILIYKIQVKVLFEYAKRKLGKTQKSLNVCFKHSFFFPDLIQIAEHRRQ